MKRRLLRISLFAAAALVVTTAGCWFAVASSGDGKCFDNVADVPARPVAMLLGCPKRMTNGEPSLEYERRVIAAAELFTAGKCGLLLVSSDVDAPVMARDAIAAGVPKERISTDTLGVRTRDSFVRAQKVYGVSGGIVVSQRYHNERSLFIADELGGDWVGYDAPPAAGWPKWKSRGREVLARVKAVLDRFVLHPEPKSLKP